MTPGMTPLMPPQPFTWAPGYNPAQNLGFGNLGGMGPMANMATSLYLQQFLGPTSFLPYGTPAQAASDQLAMREYQNATRANTYAMSSAGNSQVADFLLGGRAAFTNNPATEMNRNQANYFAGMLNDPMVKGLAAGLMGPENFESLMFGRAGDPSMMANAVNRVGYYRRDPDSGATRYDAESLESLSRNLYADLYQPSGDVQAMAEQARSSDPDSAASGVQKLRAAAGVSDSMKVLSDDEMATRFLEQGPERVNELYASYRPQGEAATVEEKAKELTRFNRAVQEADILKRDETSVGGLQQRAQNRAVEEMHGFSAGQAGQIYEEIFQRGLLPKSMGAMTPAERVALIANENADPETMDRLARDFARRDLTEKGDQRFKDAKTDAERENILDQEVNKAGGYKDRLQTTFTAIQDSNRRAGGAVSAEEAQQLLELEGAGELTGRVDSRRAGSKIKEYAGALDAIKEIFGDSGNTNAPVPALMAALEQLSQGSLHQVGAGKVESTLREMRNTAKQLGMNYVQLGEFGAAMGAYGDALGIEAPNQMAATNNALSMMNVMRREGVFASGRYGQLSEAEMQQFVGQTTMRYQGSAANKAAASILREFKTNREQYVNEDGELKDPNNEFAVVASKLDDPNWDGTYTFNGETKNFFENVGQSGMNEGLRLADAGGVDRNRFVTYANDRDTMQFAPDNAQGQALAQRADLINKDMAYMVSATMRAGAGEGSALRDTDDETTNLRRKLGAATAGMVLDTARLSPNEQLDVLEKDLLPKFKEVIKADHAARGLPVDDATIDAAAQEAMTAMVGADPEGVRGNLGEIVSKLGIIGRDRTGQSLATLSGATEYGFAGEVGLEQQDRSRRAARDKQFSEMFGGNPLAKFSDYFREIGRTGEAFSLKRMLGSVFNVTETDDIIRRLGDGPLTEYIQQAADDFSNNTVNQNYINELAAGRAVRADGTTKIEGEDIKKELLGLTTRGMERDSDEYRETVARFQKNVSEEDIAVRRSAAIDELASTDEGKKKLRKIAEKAGITADSDAELFSKLKTAGSSLDADELSTQSLLEEGEYTDNMLQQAALDRAIGHERGGTEEERAKFKEKVETSLQQLKAAGGGERAVANRFTDVIHDATKGLSGISEETKKKLFDLGLSADESKQEEFKTLLEGLDPTAAQTIREEADVLRTAKRVHLDEYFKLDDIARQEARSTGRMPSGAPTPAEPRPGAPDPSAAAEGARAGARPGEPDPEAATAASTSTAAAEAAASGMDTLAEAAGGLSAAFAEATTKFAEALTSLNAPKPGEPDPTATASAESEPGAGAATTDTTAPEEATTPAAQIAADMQTLSDAASDLTTSFTDASKTFADVAAAFQDLVPRSGGETTEETAAAETQTASMSADEAAQQAATQVRQTQVGNNAHQRQVSQTSGGGGGGGGEVRGTLTLLNLHSAVLAMKGDSMHVSDDVSGVTVMANSIPTPPYSTSAGVGVV